MTLRSRPLLIAGAIALFAASALVRLQPAFHPGEAFPRPALASPDLVAAPPPLETSAPGENASDCAELLQSGRFVELLSAASAMVDPIDRRRWLDACERLAPPPLLAKHALTLADNADRDRLLRSAIERWVLVDPAAFGEWVSVHLSDNAELDAALAHIIEHTDTIQRPTAAAVAWAGLIHDPALRVRALDAVVREWAATDAEAAIRFAETAPDLSAAQRAALLARLAPPVAET